MKKMLSALVAVAFAVPALAQAPAAAPAPAAQAPAAQAPAKPTAPGSAAAKGGNKDKTKRSPAKTDDTKKGQKQQPAKDAKAAPEAAPAAT